MSLKYSKPQPDDITIAGTNLELKGDSGFGFAIGYEYDPNWTVEFEYLTSKSNDPNGAGAQISGKFTGFHLSGVYRTDRQISAPYFIGKIGFGAVTCSLITCHLKPCTLPKPQTTSIF